MPRVAAVIPVSVSCKVLIFPSEPNVKNVGLLEVNVSENVLILLETFTPSEAVNVIVPEVVVAESSLLGVIVNTLES